MKAVVIHSYARCCAGDAFGLDHNLVLGFKRGYALPMNNFTALLL